MAITHLLASQVDLTTRARGNTYYRSGAVKIKNLSEREVAASVQGSELYKVDIVIERQVVDAFCSCPYVEREQAPCKHIWATLLAAEPRGFGANARVPLELIINGGENEDDDYDGDDTDPNFEDWEYSHRQRNNASTTTRHTASPKTDTGWKVQLDRLSKAMTPARPTSSYGPRRSIDRRLFYAVDVSGSANAGKLLLEASVQERKKDGDWSKPKTQSITTEIIQHLVEPIDAQIVAILGGADRLDNYGYDPYRYSAREVFRYRLEGPILETLLPLLARSGRVALRRQPKGELEPVVADLDPPWELNIALDKSSSGNSWVLGGNLRRGETAMGLSKVDLIVPGAVFWDGRFGRLLQTEAFAWAPVLRSVGSIPVPLKQSNEFLEKLLQMPELPPLKLPEEMACEEIAAAPKPVLAVKTAQRGHYYGGPVLEGKLSFQYDGLTVQASHPGRGLLRPATRQFLLRDREFESAAAARLRTLGFQTQWQEGEERLQLPPTKLAKVVRDLAAEGWLVEAEGKLYRQAGHFELEVKSGQDWFDLNARADFDGQPVSMPRLLAALRRGENNVVLDDGSIGMLPEDWLKKYGLIARMGKVEGDQIRFERAQVGVLDALLASRPEIEFDKQFAKARGELVKFEGIDTPEPPKGFVGELRAYQKEGLGWLRFLRKFGFGGCLADDMGLGKTVEVLALLAGKRGGPALVVVPRSLVFNWKQEAARFAPKLKVLDHTGTNRDRSGAGFKEHDIVLTTYGTLRNDAATFAEFRFDTCVLDESQAAKNADTETAKAVRLVQADYRLALSGTPIENHLGELWTLFDFLNPGMLGRTAVGGEAAFGRNPDPETREILAKALRPFILRRTKSEVAKDLPAKTEQTIYCDLEPHQRKLYDELRDHYRQSLLSRVESVGLGRSKIQVLEALLRLRQAACHPGLIDKKRKAEACAKLDVLMPQLRELLEEGHKALVFSQFTSFLDILRPRLKEEGIPFEYLDGRTRDRQERVERFQTDPECKLFLVSLKAGGVGLNLTAAEYVFLLDPWWNPAVEAQAIDRTHRIGQTKPVFAYRLIARGTVEEKVLALQESKRELADAILGGNNRVIADLKREDLEMLLS
ncbi:MAG TPA: SNF2-related protein [Urbifossiella sp.]|nr:SNF2-related protein [Urbifossiella sp.]